MDGESGWRSVWSLISDLHLSGPPGLSWEVRRWDGRRFHREDHGVSRTCVDSGDAAAPNALYDSAGFTESYRGQVFTSQT